MWPWKLRCIDFEFLLLKQLVGSKIAPEGLSQPQKEKTYKMTVYLCSKMKVTGLQLVVNCYPQTSAVHGLEFGRA